MKTEKEKQKLEFFRRKESGMNPSPLVEWIPLEAFAGKENYDRALELENLVQTSETMLRGKALCFVTNTRRLLWQSLGQEHIEPELLDFIDKIPRNDIFCDIGASNGVFALYAAVKGIKVVCFEPEIANFSLLNHNTYLNTRKINLDILNFNIALSDETGLGNIYIEKYEPGGHLKILDNDQKRRGEKFEPEYKQGVLKYRFDDFLKMTNMSIPNHIKIDVDGAEEQVLKGMRKALKDERLKRIFIELDEDGIRYNKCNKLLNENGFKLIMQKRVQNYFGEENFIYERQ